MTPTFHKRFARLMAGPEVDLPLDECCLLVSACLQPPDAVDLPRQLGRLDDLAALADAATVDDLMATLFGRGTGGFRGDTDDYANPVNSYLDRVLDRRRGIPISLAVLAIEVGRRTGLALHGVGMPGHFLVGDSRSPDRYFDVFSGGLELDGAAFHQLFVTRYGAGHRFDPSWLEPTGSFAVLARVLANLKATFGQRGDRPALAEVLALRVEVPGVAATERLELADLYTSLGRFTHAADQFDGLAGVLEDSGDPIVEPRVDALRAKAQQSRARLN